MKPELEVTDKQLSAFFGGVIDGGNYNKYMCRALTTSRYNHPYYAAASTAIAAFLRELGQEFEKAGGSPAWTLSNGVYNYACAHMFVKSPGVLPNPNDVYLLEDDPYNALFRLAGLEGLYADERPYNREIYRNWERRWELVDAFAAQMEAALNSDEGKLIVEVYNKTHQRETDHEA